MCGGLQTGTARASTVAADSGKKLELFIGILTSDCRLTQMNPLINIERERGNRNSSRWIVKLPRYLDREVQALGAGIE